jgi:hypothetical protein
MTNNFQKNIITTMPLPASDSVGATGRSPLPVALTNHAGLRQFSASM